MEPKAWVTVTFLLTFAASLLQIAGFVSPMWLWIQLGTSYYGVGLWFNVGCTGGTCMSSPNFSFGTDSYSNHPFNAVRGLQAAGVAGCVMLCIFLLTFRIGYGTWKSMNMLSTASFILCIMTDLAILAGSIVFAAFFWPWIGQSPLISTASFTWSALMCFLAAIILMVVAVLLRTKARNRAFTGATIPLSGDSKMELNPQTKNALIQRYFTPSPFTEDRRSALDQSAYYDTDDKRGDNVYSYTNRAYSTGVVETRNYTVDNKGYNGGGLSRSYSGRDNRTYVPTTTETDHVIYTGRDRGPSVYRDPPRYEPPRYETDRTLTVEYPVSQRETGTKYLGNGRVLPLSEYDPKPQGSDYYDHMGTTHTEIRTRAITGPKAVIQPIADIRSQEPVRQNGTSSMYIYRPYAPQMY